MSRTVCTLLTALLLASPLHAQTTANGSLRGRINDEQGAVLPGVLVTATSNTVPGAHQAATGGDGLYRLPNLPPGDYTVVATLSGFSEHRSTITLRAGTPSDLNLTLKIGGVGESVEVIHEAPLLDTLNGGHSVNIRGELLRAMPLSERREWYGALTLAPGVTTTEAVNNEKVFYVHGADGAANVVQIDGADMTPTVGGSVRHIALSTEAVDDIQIKTAGVDASAPLGLGGIINIATSGGSNTPKATAALFLQPLTWNASNTPGGTSSTVEQTQLDLSLGAPLKKDRLWAFGAYRHVDVNTGISRTAAQLAALQALVPGFTPFDNHNGADFWFAKGTAALSPSHQLSGFYQRDVNPLSSGDAAIAAPRTKANGGSGASVRLNSVWSDRVTTRVGASYNDKGTIGSDSGGNEPLQRIHQGTLLSGGRILGTGKLIDRGSPQTAWNEQRNSRLTLSLDTTVFITRKMGSHEIQFGVYAQPRVDFENVDLYPNGGYVYEEVVLRDAGAFDAGVAPFHRLIFDGTTNIATNRSGKDYAAYVQDAWRPIPRLTLNIGVRVDRIVWRDQIFDVTSQTSTEVGPRFGLNYALTAGGRDVVKAHWVRVHEQLAATSTSVGSVALGQRDLYDVDLDGTFETVFTTPATAAITPGRTIDADFHQPFIQEWGAGYEKQFAGGVTAGVDVLRRDFRDRPTLVETNGRYDGNVFAGYIDESINEIYQATNNRWNTPAYTSLELSLTKRTARVQGIASYARQWRHLDGTWQPHDPASFVQPSAFANDRGIGSSSGSTASASSNSLSGNSDTLASQWQDHVARLGVVATVPGSVMLATNYTFQSGAWSGPVVTRVPVSDAAFGPATIRLSNGRVVANPLATVIRFANPNRGEGQLATPALHALNIRVGRRFSVRRLTFDASLDVFNVTNHGADAGFLSGANQVYSPNFGATTYRQLPRSGQLMFRASF